MAHFKHEFSPAQECPRWERCSVNHCPLDPEQDQHLADPGDKEKKCPMEKGVRQRIGAKYPELLPLLGLTAAEAAGLSRWNRLTPAEKQALAEKGKEALKKARKP